jgi:predicted DNA-binding transcriptional regulator YafY
MRRADRLFQIVQVLRRRKVTTTARDLARELEVAPRTIYRDVVALQSLGVPIDGEAGVGYTLRPGYDLPPLMFTRDEIEAVVLGARMVAERVDARLARAAMDVIAKIEAVVPRDVANQMRKAEVLVPHPLDDAVSLGSCLPAIRLAIRHNHVLDIRYADAQGQETKRTIWPIGLYLFSHVTLVCAWCELRQAYRAFRAERVAAIQPTGATFDPKNGALMREFLAGFARR